MKRSVLRQKDAERLIKAAENQGAIVQIDLTTLVATVFPAARGTKPVDFSVKPVGILSQGNLAPDGKENWDED
ncbi:hypothetical protein [Shinella sp. JR1-6]|uniref:hypothetical protein n=1 Tax=Shinella sp. JR1-6 TaxID=2527671 RepID=UPI00102D5690|nr:hypothetical protein [Shinella sp. JR1-6]TAA54556.1 hypothetical protein EXZ48_26380 [Shinella sp. JR1-6]